MPGFFITNTEKSPELLNYDDSRCFKGELVYKEWTIKWNALDKFKNDKIFREFEEYIILIDGVILNKQELIKSYNNSWEDTILSMVKEGLNFVALLRGVFSGAIYNKRKRTWEIFTDQVGNHIVLHYEKDGNIAFGTQLNYFSDWMSMNGINKRLSQKWKDDMIGYGYMREVHTSIKSVNRVFPGSYIVISDFGKFEEVQYYKIEKKNTVYDEEEIIERLDKTFGNAILRIVNKCKEYGYKYLVDLSGGLDSRMIAQMVSTIDKNSLGINYAQIGSLDQTIAFRVADILKMECLIYPMNHGKSIELIDDLVFMNQGLSFYAGITGGKMMLEALDREVFGIELWGALGDIYEGAMITESDLSTLRWDYPRFRTSRIYKVKNKSGYSREYIDNEILWFYVRGMFAGENTALVRQNFIESITPYGDVEFMNLIFSIAYEQRTKGHIYRKWMIKKYPAMANIPYSHTEVKVTLTDKEEELRRIPIYAKNKLLKAIKPEWKESISSMNPIDYWLKTEPELRELWDHYYEDNLMIVEFDVELTDAVKTMYCSGNAMDKIVALTIISSIKQFLVK